MSPYPFYGPTTWQRAPNNSIDDKNEIEIVLVISNANFWNSTSCPPKRKAPDPKVVRVPLSILMPIC